jgi:hypothetical protein
MIRNFREKVKPYAPIDLIESERKRKRLGNRIDPVLTPAAVKESSGIARECPPTASIKTPTVDDWPVRGPTEGRKRRKRMSRRQRVGLNPSS